jgi:hypothetical protein
MSDRMDQSDPVSLLSTLDRRSFIGRAIVLGVSVTTLGMILDACSKLPEPAVPTSSFPIPPTPTNTPRKSRVPRKLDSPVAVAAEPTPTPDSGLVSEEDRIRHLLRRVGFGANQRDMEKYTKMGLSGTVDHLLNFESVDDSNLEGLLEKIDIDVNTRFGLERWWMLRMIYTERPLQEKMVLFWHGLLTSSFRRTGKAPAMYNQNQLFRSHALGDYDLLLKAVSRDPAMLLWLDSRTNRKKAPNENFARELMELFSMGIGHYTEGDVRESARAFTGWFLRGERGLKAGFLKFKFEEQEHDYGQKVFLGQRGTFDGDDIVDIILQQHVSGEFVSRKLFQFFVHAAPGDDLVQHLAGTFRENHYSVRSVMREILLSDEFYSPRAYQALVKSPAEIVAGTVRRLNITTDGSWLPGRSELMGQELFQPSNPAGWKGGPAWINSTNLIQRLNFANDITSGRNVRGRTVNTIDPFAMVTSNGVDTVDGSVDFFAKVLLDGILDEKQREILTSAVSGSMGGNSLGKRTGRSVQSMRELLYFMLASPGYQVT